MKLNSNNFNFSLPMCAKENIPLFIMYCKKELPREQEKKLDNHLKNCSDCRINFAYVEEIIDFKHPLSIDETTLLLRYTTDPIWFYSINTMKKQILKEVEELLKDSYPELHTTSTKNNYTNIGNTNNIADLSKKQSISDSSNKIHTKKNNPKDIHVDDIKIAPAFNRKLLRNLSLVALTLTFLSLGASIVLLAETKYPTIFSFISSKPNLALPNIYNNNTQRSNLDSNLYQQLDSAIDDFLSTNNQEHLTKANSIANEIDTKYQDNYGVDLVSYYKSAPDSMKEKLSSCRKKLKELASLPTGDNYKERLDSSQKLQSNFISLGNTVEAYKVKILMAKLNVRALNFDEAKIILDDGLEFAYRHNYVFLQGYFLLWKAKRQSEFTDLGLAEEEFRKTITIGKKLKIDELIISPSMSLAATHFKNDNNQEALEVAQQALNNYQQPKADVLVSLLHIAGMSAFNNKFYDLSNAYLNEAIKLSKETNNSYLLAMSYTFLAVTLTQSNQFEKAADYYLKAKLEADKIQEQRARLDILAITLGYEAKAKLSAGQYNASVELYKKTLSMMQTLSINNTLDLAQLEEGLAMALQKTGKDSDAEKHSAIAKNYKQSAQDKKETANCLLSFMPSNCVAINKY